MESRGERGVKRWLFRIAWYLCIGAGATVVGAWVIGFIHDRSGWHTDERGWSPPLGFINATNEEALVRRDARIGAELVIVLRERLPLDSEAVDLFGPEYLPWWMIKTGDESAAFREGRINAEARWGEALGWPWLAVYQSGSGRITPTSVSIDWPGLPIRPLLLGFLCDTMLHAIGFFCLDLALTNVRRIRRWKRGRCPECGYDLRGQLAAGCPECGWNRTHDQAQGPPQ
jgi:hypothetical protein